MKDAKGHGSNTRGGTAHATGVNNVGKSVSGKVLDVIRNSHTGFSVTPQGEIPTKGYMVSVSGRSQILDAAALRSQAAQGIINAYAAKNADILKQPGAHIGGWPDSATGNVHLDVSHNIQNRRAAVAAGKTQNQIAIWDVRRKREIRTGGTGDA
jgi:hypothetical protein